MRKKLFVIFLFSFFQWGCLADDNTPVPLLALQKELLEVIGQTGPSPRPSQLALPSPRTISAGCLGDSLELPADYFKTILESELQGKDSKLVKDWRAEEVLQEGEIHRLAFSTLRCLFFTNTKRTRSLPFLSPSSGRKKERFYIPSWSQEEKEAFLRAYIRSVPSFRSCNVLSDIDEADREALGDDFIRDLLRRLNYRGEELLKGKIRSVMVTKKLEGDFRVQMAFMLRNDNVSDDFQASEVVDLAWAYLDPMKLLPVVLKELLEEEVRDSKETISNWERSYRKSISYFLRNLSRKAERSENFFRNATQEQRPCSWAKLFSAPLNCQATLENNSDEEIQKLESYKELMALAKSIDSEQRKRSTRLILNILRAFKERIITKERIVLLHQFLSPIDVPGQRKNSSLENAKDIFFLNLVWGLRMVIPEIRDVFQTKGESLELGASLTHFSQEILNLFQGDLDKLIQGDFEEDQLKEQWGTLYRGFRELLAL